MILVDSGFLSLRFRRFLKFSCSPHLIHEKIAGDPVEQRYIPIGFSIVGKMAGECLLHDLSRQTVVPGQPRQVVENLAFPVPVEQPVLIHI